MVTPSVCFPPISDICVRGAIPGSHKSEFEFTFDEQITGGGDLPSCAKAIDNVAAGDAIVFTEASAQEILTTAGATAL